MLTEATDKEQLQLPMISCNRAIASVKSPEFFESKELRITPGHSCKRCRNCKDCSYRGKNALTRDRDGGKMSRGFDEV